MEDWLESVFVHLAIYSFLGHLLLIGAVRLIDPAPGEWGSAISRNFLTAVYTPFSFILFYEVISLVFVIPNSLTSSIRKQYEILSLIIVRRVFKDIGYFDDVDSWLQQSEAVNRVLFDMGGALLMFLAVAGFYHVSGLIGKREPDQAVDSFVRFKKAIALVLGAVLGVLALLNLGWWILASLGLLDDAIGGFVRPDDFFFPAFFEFMIFTDVLILIVSIRVYDDYEFLFRNSGFVISTVLLRVSLSSPKPYDLAVALVAVIYGLGLITVFAYLGRIKRND